MTDEVQQLFKGLEPGSRLQFKSPWPGLLPTQVQAVVTSRKPKGKSERWELRLTWIGVHVATVFVEIDHKGTINLGEVV